MNPWKKWLSSVLKIQVLIFDTQIFYQLLDQFDVYTYHFDFMKEYSNILTKHV